MRTPERRPRWLAARWATFAFLAACAAGQPGPLGPGSFSGDAAPEDGGLLPNAGEDAGAAARGFDGGAEAGAPRLLEDAAAIELGEIAISDEPPYAAPGARRRPKSALAASSEDDVIARWNRGGPNGGAAPDTKPPHPAPRIKVDVIQVRGRIQETDVLRVARAKGYWPFRLCYEEGLRRVPKLHGTVRFRVSVGPGGAPRGIRKVAAEVDDAAVVSCVLKAARSLVLVAPERGTPDVTLEVSLWPGDAPVRTAGGSPPSAPAPPALVTALRARWPEVRTCYAVGARRLPGLWGRLVLRLRIAANGQVTEAAEVESRFPDGDVTECVLRAYERGGLLPGEDRVIVYPLRLGTPP